MRHSTLWGPAGGLLVLALAGCAGASDTGGASKSLAGLTGFTTTVGQPKDWVIATRTNTELAYLPVGVTPSARPTPAKSLAEVEATKVELDAVRVASAANAARAVPNTPDRGVPSAAATLAEQRARLARAGRASSAPASNDDLRQAAQQARAFANRALPPGTPTSVPAVQPTSWPVPQNRRAKLKGVTLDGKPCASLQDGQITQECAAQN